MYSKINDNRNIAAKSPSPTLASLLLPCCYINHSPGQSMTGSPALHFPSGFQKLSVQSAQVIPPPKVSIGHPRVLTAHKPVGVC